MSDTRNVFLSMLMDYAPLFLLGFGICLLKGVSGIRQGYMGKTALAVVSGLIIRSAIGAAIAVGVAFMLPLVHITPDPTTMIGIVVFAAVCGLQPIDALVYKKLGIHLVDTTAYSPADEVWAGLSDKEREACIAAYRKKEQADGE